MTKAAKYKREIADERNAWAMQFDACFICGKRADWLELQTHEIYSKARARNSWGFLANYFRVCAECHQFVLPHMTSEMQLARKLVCDPENFALKPFREVAEKFTGRPTRLVDEAEILEALRQMVLAGEIIGSIR